MLELNVWLFLNNNPGDRQNIRVCVIEVIANKLCVFAHKARSNGLDEVVHKGVDHGFLFFGRKIGFFIDALAVIADLIGASDASKSTTGHGMNESAFLRCHNFSSHWLKEIKWSTHIFIFLYKNNEYTKHFF